jgi:hypothetical protein
LSDETGTPPEKSPPRRLPYERPSFSWEDALEIRPGLIAACNKAVPITGGCDTGSLQS